MGLATEEESGVPRKVWLTGLLLASEVESAVALSLAVAALETKLCDVGTVSAMMSILGGRMSKAVLSDVCHTSVTNAAARLALGNKMLETTSAFDEMSKIVPTV